MATLTIKNIPEDLYQELKKSAAQHRRSMNSEVIVCLERVLRSTPFDPEVFLARVDAIRAKTPGIFLTDADLQQAKNEGRP